MTGRENGDSYYLENENARNTQQKKFYHLHHCLSDGFKAHSKMHPSYDYTGNRYRGIDMERFPSSLTRKNYGPISTTKNYKVARGFSEGKGITFSVAPAFSSYGGFPAYKFSKFPEEEMLYFNQQLEYKNILPPDVDVNSEEEKVFAISCTALLAINPCEKVISFQNQIDYGSNLDKGDYAYALYRIFSSHICKNPLAQSDKDQTSTDIENNSSHRAEKFFQKIFNGLAWNTENINLLGIDANKDIDISSDLNKILKENQINIKIQGKGVDFSLEKFFCKTRKECIDVKKVFSIFPNVKLIKVDAKHWDWTFDSFINDIKCIEDASLNKIEQINIQFRDRDENGRDLGHVEDKENNERALTKIDEANLINFEAEEGMDLEDKLRQIGWQFYPGSRTCLIRTSDSPGLSVPLNLNNFHKQLNERLNEKEGAADKQNFEPQIFDRYAVVYKEKDIKPLTDLNNQNPDSAKNREKVKILVADKFKSSELMETFYSSKNKKSLVSKTEEVNFENIVKFFPNIQILNFKQTPLSLYNCQRLKKIMFPDPGANCKQPPHLSIVSVHPRI